MAAHSLWILARRLPKPPAVTSNAEIARISNGENTTSSSVKFATR